MNRKISAAWGAAVLIMGCGHLTAGFLRGSATTPRLLELILNVGIPVGLIYLTVTYTKYASAHAAGDSTSPGAGETADSAAATPTTQAQAPTS